MTRGFFIALSQGKYEETYRLFSSDFKAHNDFESYMKFVHEYDLDKYKAASWMENYTSPDQLTGRLTGIMFRKDNSRIPIQFTFVKESGGNWLEQGWHIQSIDTGDQVLQKLKTP